jgi:hypothetical protein
MRLVRMERIAFIMSCSILNMLNLCLLVANAFHKQLRKITISYLIATAYEMRWQQEGKDSAC